MREFIKGCAALFVVAGMIGVVIAILAAVAMMGTGVGGMGGFVGLAMAVGAAGTTLIGGTAYMLCSIDERLERMTAAPSQTADSVVPIAAPVQVAQDQYS
jgi:hypothetical protein